MCFSASVSYGSAAVLIATGAVTTLGNTSKQQRMIAAVPFLFGIQQASEGVIWQTLGLEAMDPLLRIGTLTFLSFALVIWPSWLPWSFYYVEKNEKRKRILKAIAVMGVGVSLLAASVLYRVEVAAYAVGHSLGYAFYNVNRTWPVNIEFLLYFIPTMVPFFVTSLRTLKKAGYLVFASLPLAQIINQETTTSVWCFFAALISFYIAISILWRQKGLME